ncbi:MULTISPECIES: hypothetical protein [Paenarthrobacter]|uniref:Uncharacterized protein n=1 Tax=Paenarthrobacter ureafaciens TaxID=37931 RepID=A0AAX3EJC9_PAEUR|nr:MULTISPECIES: hypothetical protein [Paenarthrobacter]MDO5863181.1 hypothetical protein [Paenarthrobacter sp. SD-2]MDO5874246.1 hypothetical protein [Paenarthrobacter sp. SD-1]MEC3851439.1 hypothetical protein [Paenarthrobacter ureafaciens]QMU81210.1 hypothetical protein FV140_02880 [Paenarthrobacter ureafaciens]UYV93670.1 hypothetical protein NL395_02925 [Paenarthrobacter ureafaciens]
MGKADGLSDGMSLPQGERMWCSRCQSDEHLVLHSIDSVHAHNVGLLVAVAYTCAECGFAQSHVTPLREVASKLNTKENLQGLIVFEDSYLHCGDPMVPLPVEVRRSITAKPVGAEELVLLDVRLGTKVLQCMDCGFRLELPA